jgi:hypothetical protein
MTTATQAQYQRAIDRARDQGGASNAQPLGDGRYKVIGRRGDVYLVIVTSDGEYTCSCLAGVHGFACWHQASAWLKRIAERMAPAATPAPVRSVEAPAPTRRLHMALMDADELADFAALYGAA